MSGSIFGKIFTVSTFGESHGKGLGVVVDGCPAGVLIDEQYIQQYLNKRKPGQSAFSTPRKEDDEVEILSGVFEGKTTGTPISLIVKNTSQRSSDYGELATCYRPGHADYTFEEKYGFRDYRGGGRSSGRETIGRVASGAVAKRILDDMGIHVHAYTKSLGDVKCETIDLSVDNELRMPDVNAYEKAKTMLQQCIKQGDSVGGVIECIVENMPAGIGEPVFDKLDARFAQAIMSIGAVKGFEIGDGFAVSESFGSRNNDAFYQDENGKTSTLTNHAGGILGGISNGNNIVMRAAIKPTPSIHQSQQTVNQKGKKIDLVIGGRHDPVIAPRAAVVVEAMVALVLVDELFVGMSAKLDRVADFYKK